MRYLSPIMLFAILAAACQRANPPASQLTYPAAAKGDVVDDYGGTKVGEIHTAGWRRSISKEVADGVARSRRGGGDRSRSHETAAARASLQQKRLTELWNYPRVSVPVVKAGELFYARNTGLQRQSPIFARAGVTAPPRLVIDPNVISEGKWVPVALAMDAVARRQAPGVPVTAEGGADWNTIRVRDIGSGKDLPDEVRWMRFSNISWTNDNKGFYYSRYPEPPQNKVLEAALSGQTLSCHTHRHATVAGHADLRAKRSPSWIINGDVTEDGRYSAHL